MLKFKWSNAGREFHWIGSKFTLLQIQNQKSTLAWMGLYDAMYHIIDIPWSHYYYPPFNCTRPQVLPTLLGKFLEIVPALK